MLEYGMSLRQVLDEITPDQVGFLLDKAEERKIRLFRELVLTYHSDPSKSLERLNGRSPQKNGSESNLSTAEGTANKGLRQLAAWAGNFDAIRKIELYEKASELMKGVKNHG